MVAADGSKARTFVRAAGAEIAWQNGSSSTGNVSFQHYDAAGSSYRTTHTSTYTGGSYEGGPAELDPMGTNVGNVNPYTQQSPGEYCVGCEQIDMEMPNYMFGQAIRMNMDGFDVPQAFGLLFWAAGMAVQCPDNNCGPRVAVNGSGDRVLSLRFTAYGDGRTGWNVPIWSNNQVTHWDKDGPHTTNYPPEIEGWKWVGSAAKEALGSCVVQVLQGYFSDYIVDGRGVKIAADARFIQGIPFIAKVPGKVGVGVIPKAMTLGLYDILFENMNLTSPSWSDLETIAEELHHAVQFVEMWQNMADIPASTERFGGHAVGREPVQRTTRTIPARRPNYAEATARWKIEYANAAIEAFKEGRELYDNRFERAAKARADAIMTDLKRKFAEKFLKGQSICP